ncbi:hypothetical protein RLOC_00000679, partial [Lonchura striata]
MKRRYLQGGQGHRNPGRGSTAPGSPPGLASHCPGHAAAHPGQLLGICHPSWECTLHSGFADCHSGLTLCPGLCGFVAEEVTKKSSVGFSCLKCRAPNPKSCLLLSAVPRL